MEIRLPQLGEGADSGSVATIFVKEGDTIQKDEPIIELESEKAVASIPSPEGGTVAKIHVSQGDTIKVGQLILTLTAGAPAKAVDAPQQAAAAAATPVPSAPATPAPAPSAPPTAADFEPDAIVNETVAAAPSVRKVARELGIDLRRVRGSERGGRIVMSDLQTYIQQLKTRAQSPSGSAGGKMAAAPAPAVDFAKWGPVTRQPLSNLRKVIAQRMQESWNTIPHVTQFDEADITDLDGLRKKHARAYEAQGGRLTFTPILLKALVATLQRHPLFNASLDEAAGELVLKEYYNIGIAVDTEHGLIVPVIREVDRKSVLQLSKELEELAAKTRDRKVAGDDLKGGTFTLSNQGGIGGAHFTPIVNHPEVAILGLGRGAWKAGITADQQMAPRLKLPLCLSYDHRVIDGGNAARFVVDLVTAIQQFPEADLQL